MRKAWSPLHSPLRSHARPRRRPTTMGWTLVELMLVVSILGTLLALAVPSLERVLEQARVARAIGDIRTLQAEIDGSSTDGSLPETLAEIGRGNLLDPWGRPYRYVSFAAAARGAGGQGVASIARKDRFLVPLNTTYDLYSAGRDGATQLPLSAPVSHDDIVRANDGGFVGVAESY